MSKQWSIAKEERGWSLNAERTWHFHKRNKEVTKWREHFKEQAILLEIPRLSKISVEVFTTFGTRALQDPANNMPAVKAAIDGLTARKHKDGWVGAGIIEDDSPEYIEYIRFWAPEYKKGYNSVCLVINEL
jgi:hypothetical protein